MTCAGRREIIQSSLGWCASSGNLSSTAVSPWESPASQVGCEPLTPMCHIFGKQTPVARTGATSNGQQRTGRPSNSCGLGGGLSDGRKQEKVAWNASRIPGRVLKSYPWTYGIPSPAPQRTDGYSRHILSNYVVYIRCDHIALDSEITGSRKCCKHERERRAFPSVGQVKP